VLHETNKIACVPPLKNREVDNIARSIGRRPSGGQTNSAVQGVLSDLDALAMLRFHDRRSHLAVLRALYQKAIAVGSLQPAMSVRDLHLDASVTKGYVSEILRELQGEGWLAIEELGNARKATVFRLEYPAAEALIRNIPNHPYTYTSNTPNNGYKCSEDCRGDCRNLWDRRVLSKQCQAVYDLLGETPLTTSELAQKLDRRVQTVRYHLQKLREPSFGNHRLVAPRLALAVSSELGHRLGPATPCQVARKLGVPKLRKKRKTTVEDERARFRER
jgi:DNA-binding MarR family transcriptional regulator